MKDSTDTAHHSALRDPARLAALRQAMLLDTPAEPAFDRLARLAARILDAPIALVTLVDADRQFFKSCIGLPEPWNSLRQTPLSHSFCQYTIASASPLVISDARDYPLVRDNLAIPDLNVIAYAGMPLITSDGVVLGSFCVIDTQPRWWTDDEIDTVREVATSVLTEIELRAQIVQRVQAEEALQALNARLETIVQERTRELMEARDELLSVSRLKSEFLATMSHELRTPMAGVIGFAELLLGTALDTHQQVQARLILESAHRLFTIINDILDLATLEAGHVASTRQYVDPTLLTRQAVQAVQAEAASKHLTLQVAIAPDLPTGLHCDHERLQRILRHLLSNAVKFTDQGMIMVQVTTEAGASEQPGVRFAVVDTGIGLSEEVRTRLFQPFTQGEGSYARKYGGLGLGLAIVKRSIEMMGGTFGVESTQGQGSTFWFTFSPAY